MRRSYRREDTFPPSRHSAGRTRGAEKERAAAGGARKESVFSFGFFQKILPLPTTAADRGGENAPPPRTDTPRDAGPPPDFSEKTKKNDENV